MARPEDHPLRPADYIPIDLVGSYPSQEAAEERMAELAGSHHMQTYWITESMTANREEKHHS